MFNLPKKVFILIIALSFILGILLFLKISMDSSKTGVATKTPNSFSPPSYGKISEIEPGQSLIDVTSNIGYPKNRRDLGSVSYLEYPTDDSALFNNEVVLENGKILYVLERNTSESYKEFVSEYEKAYGKPETILQDKEREEAKWYVYFSKGVAIDSSMGGVFKRVRFAPTTQEIFSDNIADKIGALPQQQPGSTPPPDEEEIVTPGLE